MQTAKRRVLVVEDDFFIASDLASALRGMGAEVIGPAPNRSAAIELIDKQQVNAAVLDICLDGDPVYPLASELQDPRHQLRLCDRLQRHRDSGGIPGHSVL